MCQPAATALVTKGSTCLSGTKGNEGKGRAFVPLRDTTEDTKKSREMTPSLCGK